jgi:hypothetical protein
VVNELTISNVVLLLGFLICFVAIGYYGLDVYLKQEKEKKRRKNYVSKMKGYVRGLLSLGYSKEQVEHQLICYRVHPRFVRKLLG